MFVAFIDFWITEKNVPRSGRPLDKNRNVIYDDNTCNCVSKRRNKNYSFNVVFLCLFSSLSLTL